MEWLALGFVIAFGATLVALRRDRARGRAAVLVAAIVVLSSAGAMGWRARNSLEVAHGRFVAAKLPRFGRPEDGYVSSDRCASCHPDQYTSWHRSFHRTMTQLARPDTVLGNFEKVTLALDGKTYRLERRGEEFWAELEDPFPNWDWGNPALVQAPRVWRQIGMITGSHHMQIYWVPTQSGLPLNLQIAFPFAYLLEDKRWVPLKDTFLKDPGLPPARSVWNGNCIECHTTAGQPKSERSSGRVESQVGEFGIACEACHGPGEEHIRANSNPLRRYAVHQKAKGDPTIVNPARLSSKAASQVCGQCHSIKWFYNHKDFMENGFRYRPGQELGQTMPVIQPTRIKEQPWLTGAFTRDPSYLTDHYWSDGRVRVSGRDYNGLIDAPCFQSGELSCLSCHSLHKSDPENQVAESMDGNQACLQCHTKFRANLAAHTHHAADSSGSLCYNCHMARTTYGLLKAIRNHFIESPSVAVSVATGRPNGCNLCHLDKSLAWTDQRLASWYGTKPATLSEDQKTVSAATLWALRGDAGQRALAAWHMGWEPALKASGRKWEPAFLSLLLADPYPAVRYIAYHSLKRAGGFQDFAFDPSGPPEEQAKAREKALLQCREGGAPDRVSPELLMDASGSFEISRILRLVGERDNTSMDLQE